MAATRRKKLLESGATVPAFRLTKLDGGEATLDDLATAGPVLLAFYKVTCPVCQLTFPYLERLSKGGSLPVYAVCQNDPDDARAFNKEFGVTFPTLFDNEDTHFQASNAFGISSVPTSFLIAPGGRIERVIEGWNKRDIEWLGQQAGVQVIRPTDRVPEQKPG